MDKTNQKTKPKSAKNYKRQLPDSVKELEAKMEDIRPSVSPLRDSSDSFAKAVESVDGADVAKPVCQPESESPVTTQAVKVADDSPDKPLGEVSKKDFLVLLESTLITTMNNREDAQRKASEEKVRKAKEAGIILWTPENAVKRCTDYMNGLANDYNLYKTQTDSISQQQKDALDTAKAQNETVKRLETIVGRIEDVQGVKAPKRPPFPSWACLTYLLWHWPMYAFATLWLSKYFRRFCFLITFFVIMVETCLIFLLASDNSIMHRDRTKYVTVRNWSLVEGDTATIKKFDYVDFIYSDAKFHHEDIDALHETISKKYDIMMEKKRKQQSKCK